MFESSSSSRNGDLKLAAVLLVVAVTCQLSLLAARRSAPVVSGDEGTFLAMAESLALDGDLVFGSADLERLEAAPQAGRKAVILQEFGHQAAYSKPVVYALLAAPWYKLAGAGGLVALNVVLMALSLLLAWGVLARSGARNPAATVATFAGTGVLMSYAVWTMSDSLQASLTLAGLALGLGGARRRHENGDLTGPLRAGRVESFLAGVVDRPWAPYLGAVLLALVVSMRLPNLALAMAPALAWLLRGRLRRSVVLAGIVVLVAGSGFLLNQGLAGAWVPYKSVRATFNSASGYPAGPEAEGAKRQFSEALATQRVGVRPEWQPEMSLYSTAYFWIGRHTGVLWYFPAALLLLLAGLRRPDAVGRAILLAVAALAVFYLVWMPSNYFGGATFLGNRYFLTGYSMLLLMPRRGASRGGIGVTWLVALTVFGSAFVSIVRTRDLDESSQNHAYAGLFRMLPYESTARRIDGGRDRYWSDEAVRFLDPYAEVKQVDFRLDAGSPAAEIVVATAREAGVLRFLVRSNDPDAELVYADRAGRTVFPLLRQKSGSALLVEILPKADALRHSFWNDGTKDVDGRFFSLRLAAGEGSFATLSYVGPYRFVPRFYSAALLELDMPVSGVAGAAMRLPIRLRNRGWRYWQTEGEIPIFLSYRMYRLPEREGREAYLGPLTGLEQRVPSRTDVATELRVKWPRRPGRYRIVVDPVIGGWEWFGNWNPEPVFDGEIEIGTGAEVDSETG